ncbi:Flp pilus assembly protein CpaB [Acidimangrovimonas sediminis]|uniref:Flp pilus assembly protein CpaB n=1 Tax=Acidimangrovimonas sediminis TaxID=2056283 RepID=UPI000C802527|nr:Flp pilus assembly protein CpaB [Acidimangrovimonas sediminis]
MRSVFGLVLIVGLGLAGFAVYMAQGYINRTQAELARERASRRPPEPTVTVFVAKKALPYGTKVTQDDVVAINWPKRALPPTAFTELKGKNVKRALFVEGQAQPRYVTRPISQFEPLLASNITGPGQDPGITSHLSAGMRAFAIKVDVASGVSGFLRPEDRVDVYWTGQSSRQIGGSGGEVTRLIEAGVKIIAVDQKAGGDMGPGATIARTVTVEANQEQVAVLAQAQATGRLALSLVGTREDSQNHTIEVDRQALLGITDKPAPVVAKPKVCTIKQRSGSTVVEVPIPCTN